MRIECDNCGAKYTISDEKIAGKQSRSRCKKCGHSMLVDGTHLSVGGGGAHDEATRVFDTNTGALQGGPESEGASGWYIVLDGNQTGPMEIDELSSHVQSGALDIDGFVWRDGMDDWVRLGDIPELAEALGFTNAEEDDSAGYVEEATRVVSVAPEPEKPFSFASRGSSLSESFQPAPAPGPAATLRDDFFKPAAAVAAPSPSVAPIQAAPSSAPAPVATSDSSSEFTGQRRENSVLFSLSDLTSSRSPTQKADALPRTEGSGLIDIRLLAQSQASVGASNNDKSSDGGASPAMAPRPMVPIVPIPVRRSNTALYVAIGVGSAVALALLGGIFVLMNQPPVVVAPPAPVAEASAPVAPPAVVAEVDAGAPAAEPDAAVVAAVEPDVVEASGAAAPTEASAAAVPAVVAAAEPTTPVARPTAPANNAGANVRPTPTTPAQNTPPTARPTTPAQQEEPVVAAEPATPPSRPAASARDVIAGIGGTPQNTQAAEPTPAAAPALSRSEIQSTIRRYRSQVAGCNDGSATGTYRVSFRVQANGSVQNVSVDNGDGIGNCLVGVVSGMSFPANDGNTPPITYPFPFGS
jgi:predicted Zn finger-like uncharacterized protein